ncbi:hypothetical protein TKK_0012974 [Trichogramma kaykai]
MPAKGRRTRCANGSVSLVTAYVDLPFTVGGITRDVQVDVMPDLWTDCLLGSNFIKTFQAMHNPVTNECMIGLSGSSVLMEFVPIRAAEPPKLSAAGLVEMTQRERAKLEAMLNEILPPKTGPLTHTDWIEHKINVKEGTKPIKQKYYPVSEKRQEELYQQVKDLLDEDIIEPSKSGWSSPIVMVKKSNGKYRMCIDFKKINAISEPDAYPLPYMDSILRKLAKAKYISTLDLSSAYHQINLNEKSRAMTAFTVPGLGLFQYKRMPFGLSYAGATFQRLIDMIVTPELEPNAFAYLDDIIIATETFDDHLRVLKEILSRLNDANLTVNKEKSIFGRSEVKYLGVLVNRDGIKPDPSRVEPILNFPIPKSLKQLRRFLGMSSWYRKFLKDYATLVEPLTRLTSSKVKYVWSMEQQDAFEKIKTLMAEAPLLNCPNFKEKFIVQTDASDTGLGAVLLQIIDGEERVLEFASRVLSSAERNYTVTERECLGVIWAVRKFRQYIEGYEFTVVTDHASLRWLCNLRNPTGRLARWALELQGHLYKVEHRKGSLNHVLDALSRMYEEDKEETATISYVSNSEDAWYTDIWQKIVEDPKDHPNWNIRGGQLYKFRPDANDKNLADDDEAKQSSTGMSPAELIYGVQPEQPGSFRRELELEAQDQEQDEAVTAWKAKLQGLPEKHEKAAENLKKANEKQAKYYNAGRRTTEFEVGEKVWKISKSLSNAAKGKCAKLAWDFAGPLTVTKKLGPNTFEVQHDKTGKTFSPVHASQLKPHSADEDEDEELRKVKTTNKTRDEECEMVVEKKASGTVVISKEPRTNVAIEKRATKKRTTQRDVVARDKPAEQNTRELDRNSNNSEVNGVEPRQTRSRTKAKIPSHT